jgi:hypothetical protein
VSDTPESEEREERQHGMQQHGDTFAVEGDEPERELEDDSAPNRVTALPGDEPSDDEEEEDADEQDRAPQPGLTPSPD